jgi:hypothetical protein
VDETLAHVKEKDELDLRRAVKNEPILILTAGTAALLGCRRIPPAKSTYSKASPLRRTIRLRLLRFSTQLADESDHCSQTSGDVSTSGIVETKAGLRLHPIIQYRLQ